MSRKRIFSDRMKTLLTWLVSLISVFILAAILYYIISTGASGLSWGKVMGDYKSKNILAGFVDNEHNRAGDFTPPGNLPEGSYFSKSFGFAVCDALDKANSSTVAFTYVDPESPLSYATYKQNRGVGLEPEYHPFLPEPGLIMKKITFENKAGEADYAGPQSGNMDARQTVEKIDRDAAVFTSYSAQTLGGGMRGSILASVMLILITLVIVLPIGICAAIYINEIAPDNRFTHAIRTGIDLLNGVPSIIFGLMGITMLYPVTRLFGIEGLSIVLGGLTMSVVLLPLVIRQTEEALKTVPMSIRSGSLSLGASMTQTIWRVVLPQALPGIITACLLSISRVIGESAALIYTMGVDISDHPRFDSGATTLALHIWKVMSGEQPDYEQASAISIVLLAVVLIMNFSTRYILNRLHQKQIQEA